MIQIPSVTDFSDWESHQDKDDLMERACTAFVEWFVTRYDAREKVGIVCGTGNNGGDGLGIARMLKSKNFNVSVWIIKSEKKADGFIKNRDRLPKDIPVVEISDATSFNPLDQSILIDAIFGIGLSRPVEGIYADVIRKFNSEQRVKKIAVDIPSGLKADKASSGEIIKADHTVTFIVPKLALMFPHSAAYVGEWHLEDLGLNVDFQSFFGDQHRSVFPDFYIDDRSVRKLIRSRKKFSHKGDYGRALLIAGSYGKMGAAVLAAKATLRSGVGLLTVHIPRCGYNIIQTSVPEAMASIDEQENYFSDVQGLDKYDVIGIGPGLGMNESTATALKKILDLGKPTVLDADALNIIAENPNLLYSIPAGSILTPHPGEFERLAGKSNNGFARLHLQANLSATTKSVVILKGAHTSITNPGGGGTCFNSTGNPGMAKGGSGDVLTGVLTGLLSQGYPAIEAALLGVYIHGLAADLAASKTGQTSLVAGDIVEFLGQSFSG
jgi:NAD(P)H-hydrate epimerase